MKRILMIFAAATAMLFSSCDWDEEVYYLENGMWEMINAPSTYEPTTLAFSGRQVSVMNAGSHVYPLEEGVWKYYIREEDEELYMWRYVTDYDGQEVRESHTFEFDMSDDSRTMQLVYDPLIGSTRIYEFRRI